MNKKGKQNHKQTENELNKWKKENQGIEYNNQMNKKERKREKKNFAVHPPPPLPYPYSRPSVLQNPTSCLPNSQCTMNNPDPTNQKQKKTKQINKRK